MGERGSNGGTMRTGMGGQEWENGVLLDEL